MASSPLPVFLDSGNTIVVTAGGAGSNPATGIKRGVMYRVISDVDAFVQFVATAGTAAVANAGVYLAAKQEVYIVFGMADIQGTDPFIAVYSSAAGHCFFTPALRMPSFN